MEMSQERIMRLERRGSSHVLIPTHEDRIVGFDHEVALPAEYVSLAMKATQQTGGNRTVLQYIRDNFWTLLYKRPDLYVYVSDEMVRWLGERPDKRPDL